MTHFFLFLNCASKNYRKDYLFCKCLFCWLYPCAQIFRERTRTLIETRAVCSFSYIYQILKKRLGADKQNKKNNSHTRFNDRIISYCVSHSTNETHIIKSDKIKIAGYSCAHFYKRGLLIRLISYTFGQLI